MKYGFIGLGQMGAPMAQNLSKEQDVTVFDRHEPSRERLRGGKVAIAASLADFETCDVVFLCLPHGEAVEASLFGSGGLASYIRPGTIIVDTSTIEYQRTLSIAERLSTQKVSLVDAPVSGMRSRAEDGSLTMMCGGDHEPFKSVQPVMSSMASKILYMGKTGSGQLTKLINQLLFDINAAALAEILPLAVKLDLNPDKVAEVINSGTGRSYASEFFLPRILCGDFSQGYPMAAAYKDIVSGSEITARYKIPSPVLAAASTTYQLALLSGHGDKDKGAMILAYEELLDVSFRSAPGKGESA